MRLSNIASSVVLLVTSTASALSSEGDLACIAEMEVPQMHGTLVGAVPARVEALVTVGRTGQPASIAFHPPNRPIEIEIEYYLKQATQYSTTCQGKTFKIVFSYVVEGAETDDLKYVVHFKPPNEFLIISHPMKPIIDGRRKKL